MKGPALRFLAGGRGVARRIRVGSPGVTAVRWAAVAMWAGEPPYLHAMEETLARTSREFGEIRFVVGKIDERRERVLRRVGRYFASLTGRYRARSDRASELLLPWQ